MIDKRVLVIGGTKQMGIHLVEELLRKNYDVTVANRGKTGDRFGNKIKRIIFDRYDEESVSHAFAGENAYFDTIIDTIAFNGSSVDMLFRYVQTRKYIQFSSVSVYPMLNLNQKEVDFEPLNFEVEKFQPCMERYTAGNAKYQIGKRAAEKAAMRYSRDSVIIRIPSVAGKDALNPMLKQYTQAIAHGREIHLEKCKFERKFAITETGEPGRFAVYALEHNLAGIYNVASNGYITNEMIVGYLENKLKKKANIVWGIKNECFHVDFPEHTLDTGKAKVEGFLFKNVEDWLFEALDYFVDAELKTKSRASLVITHKEEEVNPKKSLLTSMGEITYRFLTAAEYGGNWLDYLNDFEVEHFDLYVEDEGISFLPVLLQSTNRMPDMIYGNVQKPTRISTVLSGKNSVVVLPLEEAEKNEREKAMLTFCHWKYSLYKKIQELNYKNISLVAMADYSLYKNVVLKQCGTFLKEKGIKTLYAKFPQANRIKNQSHLEKYLANHSVYGVKPESAKYGLDLAEIVEGTGAKTKEKQGIYQYTDIASPNLNIMNGFRVTTDIPANTEKRIWIFGSSVVMGFYADDEHTIASSLQRELNGYFGEQNIYSVVNASNYSANDVGKVFPLIKGLPIETGDICIFNMEFPEAVLDKYKEIVDLSIYFNRPHNYGEVFADIKHMIGRGYCAQGKVLFELLRERDYFSGQQEEEKKVQNDLGGALQTGALTYEENEELQDYIREIAKYRKKTGAIVMNCNPFTLGHRYLIEQSAAKVEKLFVFVVEEDKSFFSFADRIELVRRGTADIKNVVVLPSGQFIISQRTFEAYSNKAALQEEVVDASLDVEIFGRSIAPALGINIRFAGEEPLDNVTRQYNDTMKRILPRYGVAFEVIPRKEWKGSVISASRVRSLLEKKNFEEIKEIVPGTTYEYLLEKFR